MYRCCLCALALHAHSYAVNAGGSRRKADIRSTAGGNDTIATTITPTTTAATITNKVFIAIMQSHNNLLNCPCLPTPNAATVTNYTTKLPIFKLWPASRAEAYVCVFACMYVRTYMGVYSGYIELRWKDFTFAPQSNCGYQCPHLRIIRTIARAYQYITFCCCLCVGSRRGSTLSDKIVIFTCGQ